MTHSELGSLQLSFNSLFIASIVGAGFCLKYEQLCLASIKAKCFLARCIAILAVIKIDSFHWHKYYSFGPQPA